jgi:hypothetical protein
MTASPVEYVAYDEPRLRVTVHRAPDPEAPYADDPPPVRAPLPVEGALALTPWEEPAPAPLRLVPDPEDEYDYDADDYDPDDDEDDDGAFDAVRTPRDEMEDPAPRAAMLARAVMEALAGDRPLVQLMRWTTPEVLEQLEPLVCARTMRPWATTLRKVLVCEPVPGVAEVTAIVQRGVRAAAIALRLEGVDGRWLVTALQLG